MRTLPLLLVLGCQPVRDLDYAALMEQAVDEGLPGVALYVSSPQETFDGAAGERILGEQAYQTTDLFRIASNSKTFLGAVAAQMAAEGVLDLDDRLAQHLPASLLAGMENADRATLRQALTHQSGIYDYLGSDGFWEEVDGGRTTSWTAEEALQYLQCLCLAVSGSCLGWSSGGSLIGAFAHAQASGRAPGRGHGWGVAPAGLRATGMGRGTLGGLPEDLVTT